MTFQWRQIDNLETNGQHPFQVANTLIQPSYISLQSVLAYHHLIPEYVPVTTHITIV